MAAKSPTTSVKRREVIGEEQFVQRREVFDQHATVFLPPSPAVSPVYRPVEPIVTSAHGITTANFKRNGPAHSSMREPREREPVEFRARKYSDNFSADLDQTDDGDYRRSMTDRTRRLSKMRRDFLASNLHDPSDSPFTRKGTRATLPAKYSIEFNIHKFPFAEPYATPTPVRKLRLELGPSDGVVAADKENEDPDTETKHQSLPVANNNNNTTKIDHQKLFEELVKRYSPQRKPVDWTLPPTKPRVVGSVPKTHAASLDERKVDGDKDTEGKVNGKSAIPAAKVNDESHDSTISITELAEKNDRVPELSTIQRQISREDKRPHVDKSTDLSIPALIDKMTAEGRDLETHKNDKKKVKRKRSFIDKLLGRKKEIRSQ